MIAVYIRSLLHLTLAQMGAIVSATTLGLFVGLLISGTLVDRYGPRRLQAWGGVLSVALLLVVPRLNTYLALLFVLFLLGVFLSTVPSAGTRAIFAAFPAEVRGLMMGIRQSGVPIGSAVSAVLLPSAIAAFGFVTIWPGLAFLIGLSTLLFCLSAPGVVVRPRNGQRVLQRELYPALVPMLVGFLLVAGQYCTLSFTIPYLMAHEGWPFALAGLGLASTQIGGGIGRVGFGLLSDWLGGRRALVVAVVAFLGTTMALATALLPIHVPVPLVLLLLFFLGLGAVGWNSLAITWAGEEVPPTMSGQAMSWAGSAFFLGSTLYPPLFGHVVDAFHTYESAWLGLAVLLFFAALLALTVARRQEASQAPPIGTAG